MPKHEKGTPKDIAIRMKAKGLQKLKFYCQMCQKQCRDENGFKCHLTSDSHLRQMGIFRDNASSMMDEFSTEFEVEYLDTLKRRHGTSKMNANNVYQEVIANKHHIHMNATKWTSLGDFVQYLGRSSKCVVEETERGWYVTYIDRDPEKLRREEEYRKRLEREKINEEREKKRLEVRRMEAAKAFDRVRVDGSGCEVVKATSVLDRGDDGMKSVKISLGGVTSNVGLKRKRDGVKKAVRKSVLDADEEEDHVSNLDNEAQQQQQPAAKEKDKSKQRKSRWGKDGNDAHSMNPPKSKDLHNNEAQNSKQKKIEHEQDSDSEQEYKEKKKKKKHQKEKYNDNDDENSIRKENWIRRDIIVRIISKKLRSGKYYKQKGVILKVMNKFTAQVELLDSKNAATTIEVDQDDLETVIPKKENSGEEEVCILNGRGGRGALARVVSLDKERYEGVLRLESSGRVVKGVKFEDFCLII
mmetsp:Transcript_30012/g.45263  ORF Transcript_30012/g.45263 Transcript_30012/m.45263 type:complete len:470 (-) Transcript_30012:72-1481(-)